MRRRLAMVAAVLALAGPVLAQPVVQPTVPPAADKPAAEIPFRRESLPGFDAGRWAFGVGLALVVAGGLLWWLRRRLPGAAAGPRTRRIQVLETLRVSPRSTLLLVECDGRTLLIGEQAGALVLLSSREEAPHA